MTQKKDSDDRSYSKKDVALCSDSSPSVSESSSSSISSCDAVEQSQSLISLKNILSSNSDNQSDFGIFFTLFRKVLEKGMSQSLNSDLKNFDEKNQQDYYHAVSDFLMIYAIFLVKIDELLKPDWDISWANFFFDRSTKQKIIPLNIESIKNVCDMVLTEITNKLVEKTHSLENISNIISERSLMLRQIINNSYDASYVQSANDSFLLSLPITAFYKSLFHDQSALVTVSNATPGEPNQLFFPVLQKYTEMVFKLSNADSVNKYGSSSSSAPSV